MSPLRGVACLPSPFPLGKGRQAPCSLTAAAAPPPPFPHPTTRGKGPVPWAHGALLQGEARHQAPLAGMRGKPLPQGERAHHAWVIRVLAGPSGLIFTGIGLEPFPGCFRKFGLVVFGPIRLRDTY
ncbi:hypothetical protein CDL15_Pgr008542 [Punica granatum]|uniref:Uncharacterized protein n=1 Tax=Punica granatum TaxID=22663 RepID=A0A218WP10_PUNGR|nr:hypothetical protein CDL15_Pgr008542 [Punica granatum]PKI49654.1 hypothetical protein CRG98_029961 [Punica granatum]